MVAVGRRYVVEERELGRDWKVISERAFTGNPSDSADAPMMPRPESECAAYIAKSPGGMRRVMPA